MEKSLCKYVLVAGCSMLWAAAFLFIPAIDHFYPE
jgi:hypothetical protein